MNKIIVSLTTYPDRIMGITKVLDSVMLQTYKPDKIVLYLSEEQFVEKKLSADLSSYLNDNFEIHWCQGDMKSHKKYLYAFKEFPDDYIITIDDDFYYHNEMIEEFIKNIEKFPKCVLARRVHRITSDRNGKIADYTKWWHECIGYISIPRMDLFATGCSGILYPPHIFGDEVFHVENIKRYCMYADDIWLKAMELLYEIPVVQVPIKCWDKCSIEYVQNGLYQHYNKDGGNDIQLHKVFQIYDNFQGRKESLTETLFSTGCIYEDEVEDEIIKAKYHLVVEWIEDITSFHNIVIYGAGVIASRIYKVLKQFQQEEKVKAFVVKDVSENVQSLFGINVLQYQEVDYAGTMCIIGLANLQEQLYIYQQLQQIGVEQEQIAFINPNLQQAIYDIDSVVKPYR